MTDTLRISEFEQAETDDSIDSKYRVSEAGTSEIQTFLENGGVLLVDESTIFFNDGGGVKITPGEDESALEIKGELPLIEQQERQRWAELSESLEDAS